MALASVGLGKTGYQVSRISFGALPIQKISTEALECSQGRSRVPLCHVGRHLQGTGGRGTLGTTKTSN